MDGGIDAVGVGALVAVAVPVAVFVPVVVAGADVVSVVARCVAVGVLAEEEGGGLSTVAVVVGPAVGDCGEDPQATAISSTPTAKAVTLVSRTDIRSVAHLLRSIHCRSTDPGAGRAKVLRSEGQPAGRSALVGSPECGHDTEACR